MLAAQTRVVPGSGAATRINAPMERRQVGASTGAQVFAELDL